MYLLIFAITKHKQLKKFGYRRISFVSLSSERRQFVVHLLKIATFLKRTQLSSLSHSSHFDAHFAMFETQFGYRIWVIAVSLSFRLVLASSL